MENENVDQYLDNDATGEKYTNSFRKITQVYQFCLENGMATYWDISALKGSKNKIGKLIDNLGNDLAPKVGSGYCSYKEKTSLKIRLD